MTDGPDQLHQRLSNLASDLDGMGLPGPAAARRRAARRTRHQVAGGLLAGVAVVGAGAFAIAPAVTGPDRDRDVVAEPAPTGSTESETADGMFSAPSGDPPSTEPDANTSADPSEEPEGGRSEPPEGSPATDVFVLAEEPFLTADDINPVGTYSGYADVTDNEVDGAVLASMCLDRFTQPGAETVRMGAANAEENEGTVYELVQQRSTPDSAFRVISAHTQLPQPCGELPADREQTVDGPTVIEVESLEEAIIWTVDSQPTAANAGSEGSFTGVALGRRANVVVAVAFGAFGDPTDGGWSDYAARILPIALDRATGTD